MLTIRAATEADAPLVYAIMQAAFDEYRAILDPPSGAHAETVEDVLDVMAQGGAVLAYLDQQAVGSARYLFREDFCYIGRVSVLPEQRGKGIASAMMQHIEQSARAHGSAHIEIGVRMVLESNLNLYRKLGYEIAQIHIHPRGNGEQKYATMVKPL